MPGLARLTRSSGCWRSARAGNVAAMRELMTYHNGERDAAEAGRLDGFDELAECRER